MLLIFGFLFMIFIFVGMAVIMGTGSLFIDFPSALLIIVSLVFFFLATKNGSVLGRYIKTSLKKDHTYTGTELSALSASVKNTIKFILAVGGFGFACGILGSFLNVTNTAVLGANLAVSLLTLVYAISVSFFVFFPVQAWAENKINSLADDSQV